jgi:uncharacterized SAM-binding protein YcdF (DUF218 family)
MNFFEAHKPYIFSFFLAAISCYLFLPTFACFLGSWLVICLLTALMMPDRWIRAKPASDQEAEAAIIFGFGYVMDGANMLPGAANHFMVDWLIHNHPEVKIVLAQEGANSEYELRRREGGLPDSIKIINIHQHNPGVYVNSMDVAKMAAPIMRSEGIHRVLVVAHHLQLRRAAGDMARVMEKMDMKGEVLIPDLHDVPFPLDSAQWHSRRRWRYKLVELLLSRPRDYWTGYIIK